MENAIALAVQDMHSSCSEPSVRATSRVRPVINAVLIATVQGTTVPSAGSLPAPSACPSAMACRRRMTRRPSPRDPSAWSPPV